MFHSHRDNCYTFAYVAWTMEQKVISICLVAIILTTSYAISTQQIFLSDQPEENAIQGRGVSNTIGTATLIFNSVHEDAFVAGQTHQWLKETSPNSRFTVNLSMPSAISSFTLTVYTNAASCGTSTGYYYYNASLTCNPAASGGNIYLLIQVSSVSEDDIDYSLATRLDPIWVDPPEEYTDHDLETDSQSGSPAVITAGQSISGFFTSTWDTDYLKIDTLPGIYRFNLTFSNITSVQVQYGLVDCEQGTILDNSSSSGYLTWANCIVVHTENYISFYGGGINDSGGPLQWQVSASSVQILPIEDASKGDADSPGELLNTGDSIEATMGSDGGVHDISDYFRIKIDHGRSVALRVWIEEGVRIQSVNSACIDQNDPSVITVNQLLILTPGLTTIHCLTDDNYDWLTIVFHNNKNYTSEDRVNYSFTVEEGSLFEIVTAPVSIDGGEDSDAPPEAPGIMLSTGEYSGDFQHRSDTIDAYRTVIPPGKGIIIAAHGKSVNLDGAITEGEFLSTLRIENPGIEELEEDIILRRSHPLVGNHPSFATQNESYRLSISEYNLSTSPLPVTPEFLTISSTYQIEPWGENELSAWRFAPSIHSYFNLPMQWDPTKIMRVTASQASGKEVIMLGMAWGLSSDYREGTMLLKKQLEPSRDNVEWHTLTFMGLDGSRLTITTSEGQISLLTDDGDILNSIAIGTLGTSSDEGFDRYDEWKVEMSSGYKSVLITELSGIEGSLDSGGLSDTFCFDDSSGSGGLPSLGLPYNETVRMEHHSGDGTYTLQVATSADDADCPDAQIFNVGNHQSSSTFNANPGMEMWVEVRGSFEGDIAPPVKLELRMPDSTLLWTSPSNATMDSFVVVPIPVDASTGRLHLLAYLADVIVDESFVEVDNISLSVSIGNYVIRPGQNPWLMVEARSFGEGQPANWNLSEINIWQRDSRGFPQILSSSSNISGNGSEIVQLELDEEPQPGGYIWVEGILQSGNTSTSFSDYVEVDPIDLLLSCARHNKSTDEEWINMLLCSISAHGDSIGNFQGLSGKVRILSSQNLVVLEEDFNTDEYGSDHLNFNLTNFTFGDWYVVIQPDAEWKDWVDHRDMYHFSNGYSSNQQEGDGLNSDFKLSISTEREALLGGDELVVYWELQGQTAVGLHWWISNQYGNVMSVEIDVGTQRSGTLRIDLPENITISSGHQFYMRAHSIHGATDTASVYISGLATYGELAIDISPDMPIAGESLQVDISVSSDSDWLDWDWTLRSGFSSSSIVAQGNGWNMDDHGTFSIEIPRADYPNGLFLTISATDEARNSYSQSMNINLRSLVELSIESPEHAVIGESFKIEWSVKSYAPSSVDDASLIEVSVIQLSTSQEVLKRQLLASGDSGSFSLAIEDHVKPGTYVIYIMLKTTGGSEYEYTTLIEIQSPSEPPGINMLGLNIPPLGAGYDTILTILVLANIIAVWIIFYRQKKSKEEDEEEMKDEETISEMIDFDHQQFIPPAPISAIEGFEHLPPPPGQQVVEDSEYEWQEHPPNSGKWWYRLGPWDEWTQKLN